MITGGEPALVTRQLVSLAQQAVEAGWRVEIETSGTVALGGLEEYLDVITVSPKLSHSGMPEARRIVPGVLRHLARQEASVWKFVVESGADFDEIDRLVGDYNLKNIFVMPQASSSDELTSGLRSIAPFAIARGYTLTTRLQIELWSGERGR